MPDRRVGDLTCSGCGRSDRPEQGRWLALPDAAGRLRWYWGSCTEQALGDLDNVPGAAHEDQKEQLMTEAPPIHSALPAAPTRPRLSEAVHEYSRIDGSCRGARVLSVMEDGLNPRVRVVPDGSTSGYARGVRHSTHLDRAHPSMVVIATGKQEIRSTWHRASECPHSR